MRQVSFLLLGGLVLLSSAALSHDVPYAAQLRLENGNWFAYVITGAEHMVTGLDHLLFLLGVLLFLTRFMEVVKFITAFTLGHVIVLLGASIAGVSSDHHLVDAFIALTVMYKGFENLGGFQRCLGLRSSPNLLVMVFVFGLIHGLGLASQVQLITGPDEPGWIANILWFNLGVELGQIAALAVMLVVINAWRHSGVWLPVSRLINGVLLFVGALLLLYQLHGYVHAMETMGAAGQEEGWHQHGDEPPHRH